MRYFRSGPPTNEHQSGSNALFYGSQVLLAFGIGVFMLMAGSLAWVSKPSANAAQNTKKHTIEIEQDIGDNETTETPTTQSQEM